MLSAGQESAKVANKPSCTLAQPGSSTCLPPSDPEVAAPPPAPDSFTRAEKAGYGFLATFAAAVFGYAAIRWFAPERSPANDNAAPDPVQSGVRSIPREDLEEKTSPGIHQDIAVVYETYLQLSEWESLMHISPEGADLRAQQIVDSWSALSPERRAFNDPTGSYRNGPLPPPFYIIDWAYHYRNGVSAEIPVSFDAEAAVSIAPEDVSTAHEVVAQQIDFMRLDVDIDAARKLAPDVWQRWMELPPETRSELLSRSVEPGVGTESGEAAVAPGWLELELHRRDELRGREAELGMLREQKWAYHELIGETQAVLADLRSARDGARVSYAGALDGEIRAQEKALAEYEADRASLQQRERALEAVVGSLRVGHPAIDAFIARQELGPVDIIADPVLAALPPSMDGVVENPLSPDEGTGSGVPRPVRGVLAGALDAVAIGPRGASDVSSPAMAVGDDMPASLPPTVRPPALGSVPRASAPVRSLTGTGSRPLLK